MIPNSPTERIIAASGCGILGLISLCLIAFGHSWVTIDFNRNTVSVTRFPIRRFLRTYAFRDFKYVQIVENVHSKIRRIGKDWEDAGQTFSYRLFLIGNNLSVRIHHPLSNSAIVRANAAFLEEKMQIPCRFKGRKSGINYEKAKPNFKAVLPIGTKQVIVLLSAYVILAFFALYPVAKTMVTR